MSHIYAESLHYDPRDYRTGPPGVLSGFLLLCAILAGLFLI